jgi:hypothetical protein
MTACPWLFYSGQFLEIPMTVLVIAIAKILRDERSYLSDNSTAAEAQKKRVSGL